MPAVGETVIADPRVGAFQLHAEGEEASLPVIGLTGGDRLRLEFDVVGQEFGSALEVSFVHTDRQGQVDLLPNEYLTRFETDRIDDYQRSSTASQVPYVHYSYAFPNETVEFGVSGNYRVVVRDFEGRRLIDAPFFVSEQLADVELFFGSTVQGGSVGFATQPAVRLRPDRRLQEFDGSLYTVCFGRAGRTDRFRCAPEPSLLDLALYQFYLPREAAFAEEAPLFELDLGYLAPNGEIAEVDRAATPPTALLELDYLEFGGEVRQAVLATATLIDGAFRDVGRADVDAQYVRTTFQLVPPGGRQSSRRVYVVGPFNGWTPSPATEMAWNAAAGRYQATILLKQGRYVYGYVGDRAQTPGLGAPSLFTAYVYLADPRRFTDRLIAVQSAVAR